MDESTSRMPMVRLWMLHTDFGQGIGTRPLIADPSAKTCLIENVSLDTIAMHASDRRLRYYVSAQLPAQVGSHPYKPAQRRSRALWAAPSCVFPCLGSAGRVTAPDVRAASRVVLSCDAKLNRARRARLHHVC